jgi:hypothetical protein
LPAEVGDQQEGRDGPLWVGLRISSSMAARIRLSTVGFSAITGPTSGRRRTSSRAASTGLLRG